MKLTRSRSLSAAAARFTTRIFGSGSGKSTAPDQSWQKRAWDMYKTTPEVRFVATWTGNAMSHLRLTAGLIQPDGSIEEAPEGSRAAELVASIAGGPEGQSELMAAFGRHLTVAGEGWTVIRPADTSEAGAVPGGMQGEEWHVLSTSEVQHRRGKLTAEINGDEVDIPAADPDTPPTPDTPLAIRVWTPSPERHIEADSPMRSCLELLEELRLLHAAVKAIIRSRITGRGVLMIPKGARFPTTPGQGDAEDSLIDVFMEVAETAIREPESAAATVPIILEMPQDAIDGLKWQTFESAFDELAIRLREEAIRRYALGQDIPPEVLLGMGASVNHWNVWALSEEAVRLGVLPKGKTVAHAFTTQWLRPMLAAEGDPEAHTWVVQVDSSTLRVRANRAQTALDVYDRGGISATALRRETGFDEADAPTPEESAARRPTASTATPPRLPVDETGAEPATQPDSGQPPPAERTTSTAPTTQPTAETRPEEPR